MINILNISPVSVSVELINKHPYYNEKEVDVYVNNEFYIREKRNVFSVFDLCPDTDYEIKIDEEILNVRTLKVNNIYNVKDYGIVNDGKTLNTNKIQELLDRCDNDLIIFDEGDYYTGPLNFRSNTYVYLKKNASLIGSNDRNDYPIIKAYSEDGKVNASWEGEPADQFMSIITSFDSENIMIVGEGTINGNADKADWWIDHRTMRGAWRPNNVFVNRCKNIAFVGLHIINSPSWNLHPFYSDNLDFIDLKLKSIPTSPNTDGFDPESCYNVKLIGTSIQVGDDCVAIKSGKKIMADEHYKPCEKIVIRNCYMGDGHGGVVFGSESSCGIKDVDVSNCYFYKTDRGLRIKTKRGRGNKACIENVSFDNIYMDGVESCFVINMYYYLSYQPYDDYADSKEYREVSEMTPHVGSFEFKNMECLNTKVCAGYFYGLPESKIDKISFENVNITYDHDFKEYKEPAMLYQCEKVNNGPFYFYNVGEVELKEVYIEDKKIESVEIKQNILIKMFYFYDK